MNRRGFLSACTAALVVAASITRFAQTPHRWRMFHAFHEVKFNDFGMCMSNASYWVWAFDHDSALAAARGAQHGDAMTRVHGNLPIKSERYWTEDGIARGPHDWVRGLRKGTVLT